jgi:hypothetical protein
VRTICHDNPYLSLSPSRNTSHSSIARSFSRRRITYPRPSWTQADSIQLVTTQEVETAGIAPTSDVTQVLARE